MWLYWRAHTSLRNKTVPNTGTVSILNNKNKNTISKNCASFPDCITEINNTEIDHAKEIDVVMQLM